MTTAQEIIDAFERGETPEVPSHPAAEVFPRLLKRELEEMTKDIKGRGLKEPIILHPLGMILDGVNRLKGCCQAGIKPKFKIWRGRAGEEFDFVVTCNLLRRHMDEGQRSIAAAKLAKLKKGQRGKSANLPVLTQRDAAAALNVSERNVRKARKIIEEAPENIQNLVALGTLSVRAGEAVARASSEEKENIAAMADEEAVVEAKRMAKRSTSGRTNGTTPPGESNQSDVITTDERTWSLIEKFSAFLAHWRSATEEDRAQFHTWLRLEANSGAFEVLANFAAVAVKPT